jgi:hypothetical protein
MQCEAMLGGYIWIVSAVSFVTGFVVVATVEVS